MDFQTNRFLKTPDPSKKPVSSQEPAPVLDVRQTNLGHRENKTVGNERVIILTNNSVYGPNPMKFHTNSLVPEPLPSSGDHIPVKWEADPTIISGNQGLFYSDFVAEIQSEIANPELTILKQISRQLDKANKISQNIESDIKEQEKKRERELKERETLAIPKEKKIRKRATKAEMQLRQAPSVPTLVPQTSVSNRLETIAE